MRFVDATKHKERFDNQILLQMNEDYKNSKPCDLVKPSLNKGILILFVLTMDTCDLQNYSCEKQ